MDASNAFKTHFWNIFTRYWTLIRDSETVHAVGCVHTDNWTQMEMANQLEYGSSRFQLVFRLGLADVTFIVYRTPSKICESVVQSAILFPPLEGRSRHLLI